MAATTARGPTVTLSQVPPGRGCLGSNRCRNSSALISRGGHGSSLSVGQRTGRALGASARGEAGPLGAWLFRADPSAGSAWHTTGSGPHPLGRRFEAARPPHFRRLASPSLAFLGSAHCPFQEDGDSGSSSLLLAGVLPQGSVFFLFIQAARTPGLPVHATAAGLTVAPFEGPTGPDLICESPVSADPGVLWPCPPRSLARSFLAHDVPGHVVLSPPGGGVGCFSGRPGLVWGKHGVERPRSGPHWDVTAAPRPAQRPGLRNARVYVAARHFRVISASPYPNAV